MKKLMEQGCKSFKIGGTKDFFNLVDAVVDEKSFDKNLPSRYGL